MMAPLAGAVEIVCGLLVLIGLLTRLATMPLLAVICVAIATTKLPMLAHQGLWPTFHEARADWCMLLGLIYLLIVGAGPWSLDAKILTRVRRKSRFPVDLPAANSHTPPIKTPDLSALQKKRPSAKGKGRFEDEALRLRLMIG